MHYIRQKDARILREALARLYKLGNPFVNKTVIDALTRYSAAVGEYCECPERAQTRDDGILKCLDCGKVHAVK